MSEKNTSLLGQLYGRTLRPVQSSLRDKPRIRLLLIVGPPILVLVVFLILPLLFTVWYSFLDAVPPGGSLTLENYATIFQNSVYLDIVWKTLLLTVQTTLIVTVIGYALAYSIVRFSRRTNLLLLLVIFPFWTNYIIRMYAWINILKSDGALDYVLQTLNVIQQSNGWLYTDTAVMIGFVYIWLPLAILPFYASLRNMDFDMVDAAKDLGAGPVRAFWTITIPQTRGGIIAGIVLVAIPTFGSFITPSLLGGTDVIMLGMVIERQFTSAFNWPFGAALANVVAIFMIAILAGAVKLGTSVYGSDSP